MNSKEQADIADRKMVRNMVITFSIILLLAFGFATIFNPIFEFSQEALLWLTSTIVQAFGALIAIIMVIGLHYYNQISKNFKDSMNTAQQYFKLIPDTNDARVLEEKVKALRSIQKIPQRVSKQIDNLRVRLLRIITYMLILIITSLIIMVFARGNPKIDYPDFNWGLAYLMIVLVMTSVYALILLLHEIYNIFKLRDSIEDL